MSNRFNYILPLICILVNLGCSGEKRPDGLPELIDIDIIVTQENAPLADAGIVLTSTDGSVRWTVGGKTDSRGIAKMKTHGDFPGVPAGQYKVSISKAEQVLKTKRSNPDLPPLTDELIKNIDPKLYDDSMVDTFYWTEKKYMNSKTTPLEITVSKSETKFTLDAGKKVRNKK